MALTSNHQRVGRALDFLRDGLRPFIMHEMRINKVYEDTDICIIQTLSNIFSQISFNYRVDIP